MSLPYQMAGFMRWFAFWVVDNPHSRPFTMWDLFEVHFRKRQSKHNQFFGGKTMTNSISNINTLSDAKRTIWMECVCVENCFAILFASTWTEKCRHWIIHYKSLERKMYKLFWYNSFGWRTFCFSYELSMSKREQLCKDTVGAICFCCLVCVFFFARKRVKDRVESLKRISNDLLFDALLSIMPL